MIRFAPLALAASLLAVPTLAAAHVRHSPAAARPLTIQISCFRGPWQEIIWDRAEARFTDDLVAYPQYLVGVLRGILRTQPPR